MPRARSPSRAVFDTNVLISALAFQGRTRPLWDAVEERRVGLVVSPFILGEFTRVLKDKLSFGSQRTTNLVDEILAHGQLVTPKSHIDVVERDDTDNRILECAVDGRARWLVTGDTRHLLPLSRFQGVRIIPPARLLRSLNRRRHVLPGARR